MASQETIEVIIDGKSYVAHATKEAEQSLNELNQATTKTNKGFVNMETAVSMAVGNIATNIGMYIGEKCVNAINALTKGAYDTASAWAAAVNDIGDKTGMLDEPASRILSVAQVAGVSADDMGQALMIMSRTVETNAEKFDKWGIAIRDANGNLLSSEEIFNNVLIKHRGMANGIQKNAMEMELFGRSGGKFNDFLNLSDGTIKQWSETLENAGLTLRNQVSQSMEDTDQKGRLLKATFQGMQVQIGNALNPALDELYTGLLDTAKGMIEDEATSKALKDMLGGLTTIAEGCAKVIIFIGDACAYAIRFIASLYTGLTDLMSKWADSDLDRIAGLLAQEGMLDDDAAAIAPMIQKGAQAYQNSKAAFTVPEVAKPTLGGTTQSGVVGGTTQSGVVNSILGGGGSSGAREASKAVKELTDNTEALKRSMLSMKINLMEKLGLDTTALKIEQIQMQINDLKAQGGDIQELQDLLEKVKNKTDEVSEKSVFSWSEALEASEGAFRQFGEDILTASQSLSDSFKDLFKNLANSLLKNVFNNAFNGLMGSLGIGKNADGGMAKGWSIVGEHGPELVNFSNPARVYTAQQTSAMLNGENGTGDVRVVIENHSGQNLQASQSSATFDAQGMILSVVLEASANNTDGFGTALGGALQGWSR